MDSLIRRRLGALRLALDDQLLVVLNKFDANHNPPVEAIRYAMNVPDHVPFVTCDARDKDSVKSVLLVLLQLLLDNVQG